MATCLTAMVLKSRAMLGNFARLTGAVLPGWPLWEQKCASRGRDGRSSDETEALDKYRESVVVPRH